MGLFVQFLYLQALDALTTLAGLANGIKEVNPVVRLAIRLAPSPMGGLLAVKLFATGLAVYCLLWGRRRVLVRVNIIFAAVAVWNLVLIIFCRPVAG